MARDVLALRTYGASRGSHSHEHFQALVVSSAFEALSKVRRHRLVYGALGTRMREEIHALSMATLTPAEWSQRQGQH